MASPLLSAENVSVSFEGNEVLHGVSMDIQPGITLITGPSGSGKTTMLNVLSGLQQPDSGVVLRGNQSIYDLPEGNLDKWRAGNGICFQNPSLLGGLSIRQNIEFPAQLKGVATDPEHVGELLELLGVDTFIDHALLGLSGGQKQRVALARALATRPEIVFADEPTAALDTESKEDVLTAIKDIKDELGTSIVVVTHDRVPEGFEDTHFHFVDGVNNSGVMGE